MTMFEPDSRCTRLYVRKDECDPMTRHVCARGDLRVHRYYEAQCHLHLDSACGEFDGLASNILPN